MPLVSTKGRSCQRKAAIFRRSAKTDRASGKAMAMGSASEAGIGADPRHPVGEPGVVGAEPLR